MEYYLVYIDEIIIFSKDVDEKIRHVDQIIATVGKAGVTLNLKNFGYLALQSTDLDIYLKPGRLKIDQ